MHGINSPVFDDVGFEFSAFSNRRHYASTGLPEIKTNKIEKFPAQTKHRAKNPNGWIFSGVSVELEITQKDKTNTLQSEYEQRLGLELQKSGRF